MIKRIFLIAVILVLIGGIVYIILPMEIKRKSDIDRGNGIVKQIEKYYAETGELPKTGDWEVLRKTGFTDDEFATAYPVFIKLSDSTYQIVFTLGFDPPYLMWNSLEQKWKEDIPEYVKNEN